MMAKINVDCPNLSYSGREYLDIRDDEMLKPVTSDLWKCDTLNN